MTRRPPEIVRELLRGSVAVCVDCRRGLERGEPRVTVRCEGRPGAPFTRCSDCEYRRQRA